MAYPTATHSSINPAIFYWGTPVVLITTTNEDGTYNIGPISSAFWLGNRCMLGLEHNSQTTLNLRRTKQCVLNLPSDDMTSCVNALARTTGTPVVPEVKVALGYRHVKDKFRVAGLTPEASECVEPPRIAECPVQMEAELAGEYEMMSSLPGQAKGFTLAIEVAVLKTMVTDAIRLAGYPNRIDPNAWRPMIMSFQQLYGLKAGPPAESTLAHIEEELYRLPEGRENSEDCPWIRRIGHIRKQKKNENNPIRKENPLIKDRHQEMGGVDIARSR